MIYRWSVSGQIGHIPLIAKQSLITFWRKKIMGFAQSGARSPVPASSRNFIAEIIHGTRKIPALSLVQAPPLLASDCPSNWARPSLVSRDKTCSG